MIDQYKVPKAQRLKERTISHVLRIVREWTEVSRHLGETIGDRAAKPSQASGLTGMPRRSLNEYLRLIRLGELHGFEFSSNLNNGIGVLRTFVKKLP